MSDKIKAHLADICAGLLALLVAFLAKDTGWNVHNGLTWFAVFAAVYVALRLSFMLPRIIKGVRQAKDD
ncbi:hypothetical protein DDD64_07790 [Actinotignum sanguinis]|uniref:hypothetical protein n=1 Tax=Actinotignum sanguinis TaxID=1445614 RepID=UPI000F7E22EC|nr:hypothetical protein [Actinotignum sanguinis]MDY5148337.1 hypothetical protein [Actinotignum sanguinis]RTE47867.1 hypothetical protein DDD64_07790 [Actinotignum sanguinis]